MGVVSAHPYILDKNFGDIQFSTGTIEDGPTADGVDFASTMFTNFLNGASARYNIQNTSYNPSMNVIVAEFSKDILYNDFKNNYLDKYSSQQPPTTVDCENVNNGNTLNVGNSLPNSQFCLITSVDAGTEQNQETFAWISYGKLVVISMQDSRALASSGSDKTQDFRNMLSEYLQKYPSTLVQGSSNSVERVTCEIDYGTTMSSDAKCKVKYNNKNAECTINADSDPYNICYPEPAIYIAKPSPDGGYMNVQGLSGTFEGISCSKIETAYNTNGFFVNCKQGSSAPTTPNVYSILIKGKLVDQMTGEPVKGAELISAYEFSPSKVLTDDDGNFQFTVSSDFKLKEGPEIGKNDIGAQWTFFTRCYDYAYIVMQRNYNGHSMALIGTVFDQDEKVKDISNQKTVDLGNLKMYPNADISIDSDIATSFSVMYKYKNGKGYNGPGQSGYTKEHYLSSALPLDYDVFIQFQDESGKELKSSVYTTPLEARCGVVSLKYSNGKSQWSILSQVKPTEKTGPIKIDVPEGVKKGKPGVISNICFGCLKDETCYPLGYRKGGEYCAEGKIFISQLKADSTCDNNFECYSNVCVSGKCIDEGFIQKILNWFKRLFG